MVFHYPKIGYSEGHLDLCGWCSARKFVIRDMRTLEKEEWPRKRNVLSLMKVIVSQPRFQRRFAQKVNGQS